MTISFETINILLGGGLKKYNYYSFKWLLIWIILPILMFFVAMSSVYAYFTARAEKRETDFATAFVRVGFSDDTTSSVASSSDDILANILPGSTLSVQGSVENTGTIPIYSILEFSVTIQGESEAVTQAFYTATGSELVESAGEYTTPATQINTNSNSPFQLEFTFDFDLFDDSYQGKQVHIEFVAHAIQAENIASALEATNIIMDSINT